MGIRKGFVLTDTLICLVITSTMVSLVLTMETLLNKETSSIEAYIQEDENQFQQQLYQLKDCEICIEEEETTDLEDLSLAKL